MDTFRSPRRTTFLQWRFFLAPEDYSASYSGLLQIPNSSVDQRSTTLNFLLNRQYPSEKIRINTFKRDPINILKFHVKNK
jgi:hypothetical protein